MKLIVLTDLHMVPPGERIIGLDPYARLQAGIRHINAHHADAARVIVTGDLAHHGDVASYVRVKALLGELMVPYSALLGNHDRRDAFYQVFPTVPRDRDGYAQQTLDLGGCRLVLLDTALGPLSPQPPAHHGLLCRARLAWLDAQLRSAGARPVLVFMHHPAHPTGFPGMDRIALRNGDAFFRVLRRHGNVRHIFAGHVHRTISGSYRGIPFAIFKSPVHQQPMDLQAVDSALSVDEPGAYGIVLLQPEGVIVHTEDFEVAAAAAPTTEPHST